MRFNFLFEEVQHALTEGRVGRSLEFGLDAGQQLIRLHRAGLPGPYPTTTGITEDP